MQICSIAWIKMLNIIYKENKSQSLYTNTLNFIFLPSCDDKYKRKNEMQTWFQRGTKSLKRWPPQLLLLYLASEHLAMLNDNNNNNIFISYIKYTNITPPANSKANRGRWCVDGLRFITNSWSEKVQIFTELQKLRPHCTHTCTHDIRKKAYCV